MSLSARDRLHSDMLRSTAAMIQARWPGRYVDLAQRLEDLTLRIAGMPNACPRCLGSGIDPEDDLVPGSSWELPGGPPCRQCAASETP